MLRGRVLLLATAALLLGGGPLVVAHGSDHNDGATGMGAKHEAPATSSDTPVSYWSLTDHVGVMYAHILLMTLAWVVVLPAGEC
jgi:hypothetical protein